MAAYILHACLPPRVRTSGVKPSCQSQIGKVGYISETDPATKMSESCSLAKGMLLPRHPGNFVDRIFSWHFLLAFSLGNCYFEQTKVITYAKSVIMLTLRFLSLAGITLWVFYVVYVGFRRRESWKFVFKGRVMIGERAKAVSAPSYITPRKIIRVKAVLVRK